MSAEVHEPKRGHSRAGASNAVDGAVSSATTISRSDALSVRERAASLRFSVQPARALEYKGR